MGTSKHNRLASLTLLWALILVIYAVNVDGKRLFGGGSRKTSGSSSRHSSSGSNSHVSSSSHTSNHDLTRLSYANSHASAPSYSNLGSSSINRGNTFGSSSSYQPSAPKPNTNAAPIGWNVPKSQGPPPAYSAVNPVGGAKPNLHEQPPAYRPSAPAYNPSAPAYHGSSNTNSKSFTPAQTYRPRYNSTGGSGGFGSGGIHTPITATNAGHGVQSSYPRQPSGATYYPSNSQIPPGATYYPSGSVPHSPSYYPSNSHIPPGATYYPSGVPGGHYPAPAAAPTYLPAGAALPAGAVYYAQPPKSSSGLGFGSGLAAGALGGALLGHALTPSRTYTQSSPNYAPAPVQNGEDKIIIINNGPPGSVSTTNAGDGLTVINTGNTQAQPAAQPTVPLAQPAVPLAQPAPVPQPTPVAQPTPDAHPTLAGLPVPVPPPAQPSPATGQPSPPASAQTPEQPPAGGIVCVPVRVPQPDPNDPTKTIEVDQIACYPAPPPEQSTVAPATMQSTVSNIAAPLTSSTQAPVTTSDGLKLAAFSETPKPFVAPEGTVPLAPISPSSQPDLMRIPGEISAQRSSTAMLAPESNLHVATSNSMSKHFTSFSITSFLTILLAFYLQ